MSQFLTEIALSCFIDSLTGEKGRVILKSTFTKYRYLHLKKRIATFIGSSCNFFTL